MSNVIKLPRTAQPPHTERLDTSGICRGLVGAVSGFDGFGHSINLVGGCSHVTSVYGIHFGNFNATDRYVTIPTHNKITTAELTVAFTLLYRTGAVRSYVAQGGAGASGRGWKISSGSVTDNLRFTLGGVADYTIGTPFVNGQSYSVVVTASGNGGTAKAWVNGKYIGSVAIGTMLTPASTSTIVGANHNGTTYSEFMATGSNIGNVLILDRCIRDEEAQALSANQFIRFEPETIVYSSVAGGFVPAWALKRSFILGSGLR